jgi:hypothetical protein
MAPGSFSPDKENPVENSQEKAIPDTENISAKATPDKPGR